jgi:hypothetical protein
MTDMVETIEEEEEEDMTAIKYLTHLSICLSHHYITSHLLCLTQISNIVVVNCPGMNCQGITF